MSLLNSEYQIPGAGETEQPVGADYVEYGLAHLEAYVNDSPEKDDPNAEKYEEIIKAGERIHSMREMAIANIINERLRR